MDHYSVGDSVTFTGTFRDAAGAVADPTTITLKVEAPDGTETTYTYALGTVTKDSTGVYSKAVTLSSAGTWSYRFIGAGSVVATIDGQVYATASTFDTDLTGWNEMRERVYTVVRDNQNREFVTPDQVDIWMREGMTELTSRLQLTQAETTGVTSGATLALPTAYVDMVWLKVVDSGDSDDYVQWVDEDVWNSWDEGSWDPGMTLGRVFNGNVELYPTPTTGTAYTMRYWTTSDASLTGLTGSLKTRIVHYARAHALWKWGESSLGDKYFSLFEQHLPNPDLQSKNRAPGPISLYPRFDGWFDSAAYRD